MARNLVKKSFDVSEDDLREVLIQVTLYAVIPAGAEGMTVANAVLKEASFV